MKKFLIAIFLVVYYIITVHAQTNAELLTAVSEADKSILAEKGYVIRENSDSILQFLPNTEFANRIDISKKRMKSTIKYEGIYIVEVPISDEEFLAFYHTLMNISIYPQCNYYNRRHNNWWPVFEESYYIASEKSREPILFSEADSIPENEKRLAYQSLPPYGGLINEYSLTSDHTMIHLSVKNIVPLKYEGINILAKDNFRIDFLAVRTADGMVLYTLISADVFDMMGILRTKVTGTIGDRLQGFSEWYMKDVISPVFKK